MALQLLEDWLNQAELALQQGLPIEVAHYIWAALWTALGAAALYRTYRPLDKPRLYSFSGPKVPEREEILEQPSTSGTLAIQCYNSTTGQFLGLINPSTPAAVDRIIEQAATAQKKRAATSFRERRAVLRSMLPHVLDNQEMIYKVACLNSGKNMVDVQVGEILITTKKLQWTIKYGERALVPSKRPTNLLLLHNRNIVIYEPLGVVAALTAWSAQYFASIARGALVAHGHDPGLIQTIVCWPQTAAYITSQPAISHITFVGSQAVAQKVAAAAAKALIPVCAELGGKDPFILLQSALPNVKSIVEVLLRATFQSSGQNCIGAERSIAAPGVYDHLIPLLTDRIKDLRLGLDLESFIGDAILHGAHVLAGAKRHVHPDWPRRHYFLPTLIVDVTPEMEIANEEYFGPILILRKAENGNFSSPEAEAEAILKMANAPNFGLGSFVFGRDSDPVLKAIVHGFKAGMIAVYNFATYFAAQKPFGGIEGSGYGRFAGEEGLRGH
ncbi:Meiotic Sister-Chromatid recombination aldehyde dehydrogenase [Xylographa vitiligo]|nr:Meiotic Sister-Chromatid recombination aldehyde dehydrogenase [Xylographa vitiligo]